MKNNAELVGSEIIHKDQPLVSICCITFNHEKFIRDAIEGFLIQKTNFPIEILIHDDASTDGTTDIIREYQIAHPDFIKAIYQAENQYSRGRKPSTIILPEARGKYIALCEGDDYWTDPLKLQKQVDFLDAHPECSLCCHKLIESYENGRTPDRIFPNIQGDQVFNKEYLYRNFFIRTCSVVFRNDAIDSMIKFLEGFKVGDAPLFYYYAQRGTIGYLDDCMSVYRFHYGGVWSNNPLIKILLDSLSTRLILQKKLGIYFSKGFHEGTLELMLRIMDYYKREDNHYLLRKIVYKSVPYLFYADKKQKKKIFKYLLRIYLPGFLSDRL